MSVEIRFLLVLDRKIIRSVSLLNHTVKWREVREKVAVLFEGKPNSEVLIEAKSPHSLQSYHFTSKYVISNASQLIEKEEEFRKLESGSHSTCTQDKIGPSVFICKIV
jgi:hypothetical protein